MSAASIRNLFLGALLIASAVAFLYFARDLMFPPAHTAAVATPVQEPRETAYVTARAVARGQPLTRQDLSTVVILGAAPRGVVTDIDAALGRVVLHDTPAGQFVMTAGISSNPADAGLAPLIPVGQRAFSLRIDETIAAGDFLRPGDRVDILLVLGERMLGRVAPGDLPPELVGNRSEALPLLQNVSVLTVGDTMTLMRDENGDSRRRAVRTLSVAVTPEEGAILTLARELGDYAIALRNPHDDEQVERRSVTLADIRLRLGAQSGLAEMLEAVAAGDLPPPVPGPDVPALADLAPVRPVEPAEGQADAEQILVATPAELGALLARACPDPVPRNIIFLNGLETTTQVLLERP